MLRERFVLPDVSAVATVPPRERSSKIVQCAALIAALGAQPNGEEMTHGSVSDAVSKDVAIQLLGGPELVKERWLRGPTGKQLRIPNEKVGGHVAYSRRKIIAFLRGDPVE